MKDQPVDASPAGVTDYSKPVAYDTEGRPLYLHPTDNQGQAVQPAATTQPPAGGQDWAPAFNPQSHGNHQYVHVSRPVAPADPAIPEAVMQRYEESLKKYPHLNLSKGEYIISAVQRHPIGLVQIWVAVVLLIAAMAGVLATFLGGAESETIVTAVAGLGLVSLLVLVGGMVAAYIYNSNRFYLTNESVIQEIMIGLLNKHEQTVSLANIEDASYYQTGIFASLFDYGTIRLSTEGDETTYRFSYVAKPKRQIALLNNAVEAFKNGRPVEPPTEDQSS